MFYVQAIYFGLGWIFSQNPGKYSECIIALQTKITIIFWFWVEIYEGDPLVSNKHSLSDTGMKTVLLKRPEITFMKINFISTWTISTECSGHKHFFLLSQQDFLCWLILNPWELTGASLQSWQKPSHELNTRLKGQSWHRFWGRKNQPGQTW